jgi:hypothetical protein
MVIHHLVKVREPWNDDGPAPGSERFDDRERSTLCDNRCRIGE